MESVTIKISRELFDSLALEEQDYEIKLISVKDDLFKNDPVHKAFKKAADKAYKSLHEYEFKKRHNINQ